MSAEAAPRTAARKRKVRWALAGLAVLLVAVAAIAVPAIAGRGDTTASPYETASASIETIEVVASGDGETVVATSTSVYPGVSGTIDDVYVELGDTVATGDLLFVIDDTDLRSAATKAQASLLQSQQSKDQAQQSSNQAEQSVLQAEQALAQSEQSLLQAKQARLQADVTLLQAEQNLEALESKPDTTAGLADQIELAEKQLDSAQAGVSSAQAGIITAQAGVSASQAGVTTAKSGLVTAQAGVDTAATNLTSAQSSYDDAVADLNAARVYAPADGVVTTLSVEKGGSASGTGGATAAGAGATAGSSSSAAVVISDLNELKVRIQVNEIDLAALEVGQTAALAFDALPDLMVDGVVSWISPNGVNTSGVVSYDVDLTFSEQDPDLKPDMTATADIITVVSEDVLAVPNAAIKVDGSQKFVEVPDSSGEPQRVDVTVGASDDTYTEIVDGLSAGQEVITGTTAEETASEGAGPFAGDN